MQPTRQITVFFSFLAVLTLTGGLLLALEPEPLTPVDQAPVLVVATDTTTPSSLGNTLDDTPSLTGGSPTVITTRR